VIVERNAWTLAQERYNAEWVSERGVGMVLRNFTGVEKAVAEMLQRLNEFRAAVDKIENRAVFEIPDMLARLPGVG
jgi:UDP-N-acetylglucosamine:LPS N-acetylglucosamine transferase